MAMSCSSTRVVWSAGALLLSTSIAGAQVPATAGPTSLPQVTGPIPVTVDSHPYLALKFAQRPMDLDAIGYIEEEFFISGTANVYDWAGAQPHPVVRGHGPYTTRILVRRPASRGRFTGNVYVEILNPARGYDTAVFFGFTAEHLMSGHAWVGVTTNATAQAGLKRFDPARYASMSLANPLPAPRQADFCAASPPQGQGGSGRGGAGAPVIPRGYPDENGLRFDAFSQIGAWLRSDSLTNPLAELGVQYVVMVSHTGGDVATYAAGVSRLARLNSERPVYDAFVMKSGSGVGTMSNCGRALALDDPRRLFANLGVPVIVIKPQNDVPSTRRPDSDGPDDMFRLYEIPGASHSDRWPYRFLPVNADLRKTVDLPHDVDRGVVTDLWPYARGCDVAGITMNDFPIGYLINGALANLDTWLRSGLPPPRAERIATKPDGEIVTDQYGNAVGGVRTPMLDVPIATYLAGTPGDFATCDTIGYRAAWDWSRLEAVHGSYDSYAGKVLASIDGLVRDRWITPADAVRMRHDLVRRRPAAREP
jgi:hypothetical protein